MPMKLLPLYTHVKVQLDILLSFPINSQIYFPRTRIQINNRSLTSSTSSINARCDEVRFETMMKIEKLQNRALIVISR